VWGGKEEVGEQLGEVEVTLGRRDALGGDAGRRVAGWKKSGYFDRSDLLGA
jgi:hypothetical protein